MNKIYLFLAMSTIAFISAQANAAATHPASKEWVLEQLKGLQTSSGSSGSFLSTTDWTNLCPQGQSIDSTTGCTPNCNGAQKTACAKVVTTTEVEDQTLLSRTAATGLTVFRLTVNPTFANTAPTFENGSNSNNVRCQTFTLHGTLLNNQNDNFLLNSSTEANYQQFSAGVDLSPNVASNDNQLLAVSPGSGAQRQNQQYYVICMAYTVNSNIATNVNMDSTLTITWT